MFPMSALGDATLTKLANQMKPKTVGASRRTHGVNHLPFTVAGGECESWVKGGSTTN